MVLESEQVDVRDEEIFHLQQLLYAAEARIHDLETIVNDRYPTGDESLTGANHNAPVLAEEEKPYRRGYSQGFSLCRQYVELAAEHGMTDGQVAKALLACESKIFKWRGKAVNWIRGKIVKAEWPPNPLHLLPKSR